MKIQKLIARNKNCEWRIPEWFLYHPSLGKNVNEHSYLERQLSPKCLCWSYCSSQGFNGNLNHCHFLFYKQVSSWLITPHNLTADGLMYTTIITASGRKQSHLSFLLSALHITFKGIPLATHIIYIENKSGKLFFRPANLLWYPVCKTPEW